MHHNLGLADCGQCGGSERQFLDGWMRVTGLEAGQVLETPAQSYRNDRPRHLMLY